MITITTDRPRELLNNIRQAIDRKTVETWQYDSDGDFTHCPDQWKNKAWLRPSLEPNQLCFYVVPPKKGVSTEIYAIYHGRFIEMLLAHFDGGFSLAFATAMPAGKDDVSKHNNSI